MGAGVLCIWQLGLALWMSWKCSWRIWKRPTGWSMSMQLTRAVSLRSFWPSREVCSFLCDSCVLYTWSLAWTQYMANLVRRKHGNISDKNNIIVLFLAKQRGLLHSLICCMHGLLHAVFNPKKCISIQKGRPYTENLNSEMPGDSTKAILRCGELYLGLLHCHLVRLDCRNITHMNSNMVINRDAYVAPILELQLARKLLLLVTWAHAQAEMLDHVMVADRTAVQGLLTRIATHLSFWSSCRTPPKLWEYLY